MTKNKKKQLDKPDDVSQLSSLSPDGDTDMSQLSLSDRVRALLGPDGVQRLAEAPPPMARNRADLAPERQGKRPKKQPLGSPETARRAPLAPTGPDDARWTVVAVMDRITEAFRVLGRLPMATRPQAFGNAMPTVVQQRFSLLDLLEMEDFGLLNRLVEDRNRVRIAVTAAEISRMDQAFAWSLDYLADYPEIAKAVGFGGLWEAQGVDIPKRCKSIGLPRRTFLRRRVHGVTIITMRLIQDGVPVS